MIGYESANFFCFTLHAIQAAKVNLQSENQMEIPMQGDNPMNSSQNKSPLRSDHYVNV